MLLTTFSNPQSRSLTNCILLVRLLSRQFLRHQSLFSRAPHCRLSCIKRTVEIKVHELYKSCPISLDETRLAKANSVLSHSLQFWIFLVPSIFYPSHLCVCVCLFPCLSLCLWVWMWFRSTAAYLLWPNGHSLADRTYQPSLPCSPSTYLNFYLPFQHLSCLLTPIPRSINHHYEHQQVTSSPLAFYKTSLLSWVRSTHFSLK